MNAINFFEVTEYRTEYVGTVNKLLRQLTTSTVELNEGSLLEIINSDESHLFFACTDDSVIGMATLAFCHTPTGTKGWIEDVIVDSCFRGKGIGKQLMQHTVDYARKFAPCTLMLTSRPARVAANRLYQSIGFDRKETNVYRMKLS